MSVVAIYNWKKTNVTQISLSSSGKQHEQKDQVDEFLVNGLTNSAIKLTGAAS